MYILVDNDNMIMSICSEPILYNDYHKGYYVEQENTVYPADSRVFTVPSVASDTKPYSHCYTPESGAYANPNYLEPILPMEEATKKIKALEVKLAAAEADNLTTLEALAEVYEMIIPLLG